MGVGGKGESYTVKIAVWVWGGWERELLYSETHCVGLGVGGKGEILYSEIHCIGTCVEITCIRTYVDACSYTVNFDVCPYTCNFTTVVSDRIQSSLKYMYVGILVYLLKKRNDIEKKGKKLY